MTRPPHLSSGRIDKGPAYWFSGLSEALHAGQ
jgi:hypothetical protein